MMRGSRYSKPFIFRHGRTRSVGAGLVPARGPIKKAGQGQALPLQFLICLSLILLILQGCQRANSAREPTSSSAPVNSRPEIVKRDHMVLIKGGTFLMGTNDGMP